MKLVKLFGFVMAAHAAVFMFVFAIPGCRSSGKKPAAPAATPVGAETSPVAASETVSPVSTSSSVATAEVSAIRFSPTRPGTPTAAEVTAAPAPATYTVVKGDNLWAIAKKNGITVKELTAVNNLRTDSTLKLGQVLTLPGKATSSAAPAASVAVPSVSAPAKAATASTTHVVKAGETLGVIAKKYQVKVGEIATANNIADPTKLRVGQTLKIPGSQASASSAKSAAPAVKAPAATAPAPAPAAPAAPVFTSPFESTTTTPAPAAESPFITPAPATDAPLIRVEESGAPRIE